MASMQQKAGISVILVSIPQKVGIKMILADMQRKVDIGVILARSPPNSPRSSLPRSIRKISLAISGAHDNVLKCNRVQQPFLLPISFNPSTHSPKTTRSPPNSPRSFKRYIHIHTPFSSARSAKKKMYGIGSSIPFPSARSAEKTVLYTSSARAAYLYVDRMPSVLIRNFCVGKI